MRSHLQRQVMRATAVLGVWALAGLAATAMAADGTLVQGSAKAGKAKSTVCAACHGVDGNSPAPTFPSLAGQHATYLVRELKAFQTGKRPDPVMVGFAAPLSEQDIRDLAVYFSKQTLTPKGADPKLVDQGAKIYRAGIPDQNVPACSGCHSPDGSGNLLAAYPHIASQHQKYMMDTLKNFADGTRRSDPNSMMRMVASRLTEDQMRAVTSYIQGLQPGKP